MYIYSTNHASSFVNAQKLKLDKKNPNIFRLKNKSNKFLLLCINEKTFKTIDGSIWNYVSD